MKSIGESAARMRQLKLAITWGHEKVAKELIFEKQDYKFRVSYPTISKLLNHYRKAETVDYFHAVLCKTEFNLKYYLKQLPAR